MKKGSNGLFYPFDNRPNPGELIEVGPGIYWVRMPLPISLNHINLVSAIEVEFKIKFTLGELMVLKDVGVMVNLILEKLK